MGEEEGVVAVWGRDLERERVVVAAAVLAQDVGLLVSHLPGPQPVPFALQAQHRRFHAQVKKGVVFDLTN